MKHASYAAYALVLPIIVLTSTAPVRAQEQSSPTFKPEAI